MQSFVCEDRSLSAFLTARRCAYPCVAQ